MPSSLTRHAPWPFLGSALALAASTGCVRLETELPGSHALVLEAGDFDGDGRSDLVVGYRSSPEAMTLAALVGRGDGTFEIRPVDEIPGALPRDFAVADFDGDDHLDFAVVYRQADGLGETAVYLGDGAGSFALSARLEDPERPSQVVAAEVAGDGHVDLLIGGVHETFPSPGRVLLFTGRGDGSFAAPADNVACVEEAPRALTFTSAGQVITATRTRVLVHTPDGGDFGDCEGDIVFDDPEADLQDLASAPLNPGDDTPDVAVVDGRGWMFFLHGDGAGFPPHVQTEQDLGDLPRAVAIIELPGAAHPAIAVADEGRSTASLYTGMLMPTDEPPPFDALYRVGPGIHADVTAAPTDVTVADFTGDGRLDIATIGPDVELSSVAVLVAEPNSLVEL